MCGILGISTTSRVDTFPKTKFEHLLQLQHHRGPDSSGIWESEDNTVYLGHNRLSIIDLSSSGDQPIISRCGQVVLVFNGEIYNYKYLKGRLVSKGFIFRSSTDSEVLLNLYLDIGLKLFNEIEGMYAFAIYDLRTNDLICARDPIGKKPLYYTSASDAFFFASELKTVRAYTGPTNNINHSAILSILLKNLRHIPDPYTAYNDISTLRPGHYIVINNAKIITDHCFWSHTTPTYTPETFTATYLRQLFERAVDLRLDADVPIGILLSGGLDSSAIASYASTVSSRPISTYSLSYGNTDTDALFSNHFSKTLGLHHHEIIIDPESLLHSTINLIHEFAEPIALLPLAYTSMLTHAMSLDGVKVGLTGNGADELFCGYNGHLRSYQVSRLLQLLCNNIRSSFIPAQTANMLCNSILYPFNKEFLYKLDFKQVLRCTTSQSRPALQCLVSKEINRICQHARSNLPIDHSVITGLLYENQHSITLAPDFAGMINSVELRSPFLDDQIVNYALSLPPSHKICRFNSSWIHKSILRTALANYVPSYISSSPKRGFGFSLKEHYLFHNQWREYAHSLFTDPLSANGLFDTIRIRDIWLNFLAGSVPASTIMKHFSIQVWLRNQPLNS